MLCKPPKRDGCIKSNMLIHSITETDNEIWKPEAISAGICNRKKLFCQIQKLKKSENYLYISSILQFDVNSIIEVSFEIECF